VKAYVHKGRALVCLKRFDEALSEFEAAKTKAAKDPGTQATIDGYVKELERCRQTDSQEKSVEEFLKGGGKNGVVEILEEINKVPIENLLYYSGGLRALARAVKDGGVESRTLLRVQGGLKIIDEHRIVGKCFGSNSAEVVKNPLAIELVMSVFEMAEAACEACGKLINIYCFKYFKIL